MPSLRKVGEKLGVSDTTIADWIAHYSEYFSNSATKTGRARSLTENDLDILATIANASHDGLNRDDITEKLAAGDRIEFTGTILGTDTRMIPAAAAESMIDATEIRTELEITKSALNKALNTIETERKDHKKELHEASESYKSEVQDLQKQIAELQHKLGLAEGELNYRRQLDDK